MAPFCSCPASLVSRKFFAVGPGCAKCFFLLGSVGRRDLSAGPEQKQNNTTQGVFFCSGPGERQGKEKPRAGTGPEQEKNTWVVFVFFFGCGPGERQGKEKPRWAPARGQSKKKKHHPGYCFLLRPQGKAGEGEAPLGAGTGLVPAPNGASPSPAFPRGRSKKKKQPGWCFFLLRPRADAHSLTAGLGGDLSWPGWCSFFCCGPARTGVVFIFCCGPARTLTHSLWAGAISARPGWCFFFGSGPAGSF